MDLLCYLSLILLLGCTFTRSIVCIYTRMYIEKPFIKDTIPQIFVNSWKEMNDKMWYCSHNRIVYCRQNVIATHLEHIREIKRNICHIIPFILKEKTAKVKV